MPTMLDPGTLKRSFSRLNSPHFTLKIRTTPSSQNQNSVMQLKYFFPPNALNFFRQTFVVLTNIMQLLQLCFVYIRIFLTMHVCTAAVVHGCVCACETVPAHLFLPLLPVEMNEAQSCSLKVKANTRTHASKGNADMVVQSSAG